MKNNQALVIKSNIVKKMIPIMINMKINDKSDNNDDNDNNDDIDNNDDNDNNDNNDNNEYK